MATSEKTTEEAQVILTMLQEQLGRRGTNAVTVSPQARLMEDLEMDSLEMAELSAELEDKIGRDPFSQGIIPDTVAELIAFYDQP